jgi:PH domain
MRSRRLSLIHVVFFFFFFNSLLFFPLPFLFHILFPCLSLLMFSRGSFSSSCSTLFLFPPSFSYSPLGTHVHSVAFFLLPCFSPSPFFSLALFPCVSLWLPYCSFPLSPSCSTPSSSSRSSSSSLSLSRTLSLELSNSLSNSPLDTLWLYSKLQGTQLNRRGWLKKKGAKRRNWTRRFCELDADAALLHYSESERALVSRVYKGSVELSLATRAGIGEHHRHAAPGTLSSARKQDEASDRLSWRSSSAGQLTRKARDAPAPHTAWQTANTSQAMRRRAHPRLALLGQRPHVSSRSSTVPSSPPASRLSTLLTRHDSGPKGMEAMCSFLPCVFFFFFLIFLFSLFSGWCANVAVRVCVCVCVCVFVFVCECGSLVVHLPTRAPWSRLFLLH